MLKLATILQNPGEPAIETRYSQPKELKRLGYNGLVLYETTALSGVGNPDRIRDGEIRHWVTGQFETVSRLIDGARGAGLAVYVSYDVLTLVREAFEREVKALSCRNHPQSLCPGSPTALHRCGDALNELLDQIPDVDGVVIRFGDSDAARLPHLVGGDIYWPRCTRCAHTPPVDRICNVLTVYRQLVVQQRGKRLIVRAWNVRSGGVHDDVELCRHVADRLEKAFGETGGDGEKVVWSFKFTQADFRRYQRWNPSSLIMGASGRWPIIYELECQREYEGKGGIPNWQVPLWRDGAPECDDQERGGLAHVADRVNLAGLWAWVRGGGWGGPFVNHEDWIDANVFAVPALADDPAADIGRLAQRWIDERLGIRDPAVTDAIRSILEHSPRVVLHGLYIHRRVPAMADEGDKVGQWIQDDQIDARITWRIIQTLSQSLLDEAVRLKEDAVDQTASDRTRLQGLMNDRNRSVIDPLVNTLVYSESLLAALRDLLAGLAAYRRYQAGGGLGHAQQCHQKLLAAQSWWNHHTQRHGSLPGTATAFREVGFWELTQRIVTEVSTA